jgi:hypothetical protein
MYIRGHGHHIGKRSLSKVFKVLLSGYIIDDGGDTITERGFIYGDTSLMANSVVATGNNLLFTAQITIPYKTIYYSAYAKNSQGTSVSDMKVNIIS